MKQVTYTHLDGNVTIFTANTAIVKSYIDPNTKQPLPYTVYLADWGFGTWAEERLTAEDYSQFTANVAIWATNDEAITPKHELETFKHYWTMFYTDPNVNVEE